MRNSGIVGCLLCMSTAASAWPAPPPAAPVPPPASPAPVAAEPSPTAPVEVEDADAVFDGGSKPNAKVVRGDADEDDGRHRQRGTPRRYRDDDLDDDAEESRPRRRRYVEREEVDRESSEPIDAVVLRRGVAFEIGIGLGLMSATSDTGSSGSAFGLAGISAGLGGYLSENVALTLRISGGTVSENGERLGQYFAGPALQRWLSDTVWVGGGVGLGVAQLISSGATVIDTDLGFSARIGANLTGRSLHSINLSAEYTVGLHDGAALSFTGLLLSYQTL